ncbi:serine/threonine protein phosphatase, partial [Streptomyces sp. NPDC057052]
MGRGGDVVEVNEAARSILPRPADDDRPERSVPSWLSDAHRRLTRTGTGTRPPEPAEGTIDERTFRAHPTTGPALDGDVVWWLVEDTDLRLTEQALRSSRERAAVLAEVSGVLLSPLDVDQCLDATARMAADHLADAAVVVAPAPGRRHALTYADGGGRAVRATLEIDTGSVPGLAEALQGFPPVPARWISPDDIPDWAVPPGFTGTVGSVIVAPLPGHGVPAGALVLLRTGGRRAFSEDEEIFARLFAARAGAALSAARLYAEQSSIA